MLPSSYYYQQRTGCNVSKQSHGDYGMLVNQLCPDGYAFIDKSRKTKGGGGIGVVYNKKLKMSSVSVSAHPTSFT